MFQKPSPQIALSQEEETYTAYPPAHSSSDEVETVVGPSVQVEGDFSSEGNIIVKGTVSGSVKTSRLLSVENGARILANVKAGNAVIAGQVKGNISVTDRVELTETAEVWGDIHCQTLIVAPGAVLQGKVNMRPDEDERGEKKSKGSLRSKSRIAEGDGEGMLSE